MGRAGFGVVGCGASLSLGRAGSWHAGHGVWLCPEAGFCLLVSRVRYWGAGWGAHSVLELVSACLWVGQGPRGFHYWCRLTSGWSWVLRSLGAGPWGSQSWCWPAGGWSWGQESPGTVVHSLVGGVRSWDVWLWWSRGLGAHVGLLVGEARAQGVLGLVLAHWWAEPGHRVSGCRALGIPDL